MKFHSRRLRAVLPAALMACAFNAPAADWQTDPARSTLAFAGAVEGEAFSGRFKTFTPVIQFDPAQLESARFDVEITLASADSANAERDETLQGDDFFASARFPNAHYRATRFRQIGDGRFVAEGTLSLRGVDKPVPLEFTWKTGADGAVLEGSATVNRLDFGVGGGDWADAGTISHEISVTTTLHLSPR